MSQVCSSALITEEGDFPIQNAKLTEQDACGRHVITIVFPHFQKNAYGQWLSCGIYYDTKDHGIRFKKKGVPELAFFLDMWPEKAKNLSPEIKNAFKNLVSKSDNGFEENTEGKITQNRWRVLFKRIPLTEIASLDPQSLKTFLYACINEVAQEKTLAALLPGVTHHHSCGN